MILIKNKEQTHKRRNQEQMKIMALDAKELKETTRENATPHCSKMERNSCIFCSWQNIADLQIISVSTYFIIYFIYTHFDQPRSHPCSLSLAGEVFLKS